MSWPRGFSTQSDRGNGLSRLTAGVDTDGVGARSPNSIGTSRAPAVLALVAIATSVVPEGDVGVIEVGDEQAARILSHDTGRVGGEGTIKDSVAVGAACVITGL